MSTKPDDGGPAFPMGVPEGAHYGHPAYSQTGMTLRDWFAGMALSGIMNLKANQRSLAEHDATYCYQIADAMLAARKEAAR